ncbi:MAG: NUDIX domain-containing protein [Acidimicrobiales bacterium]
MNAWVLRRQAARVVLLNDLDQVFLIKAIDPADPTKPPWWEIPGGGIDPGEASEHAAYRELREEAGITEAEVGPIVWVQHVEFDFGGYHFDQNEVIHVARTTERAIHEPQGLEALEALAFKEARWWSREEVAAADTNFLPPGLPNLLPQLIDGPLPDPPLDISPEPGPAQG